MSLYPAVPTEDSHRSDRGDHQIHNRQGLGMQRHFLAPPLNDHPQLYKSNRLRLQRFQYLKLIRLILLPPPPGWSGRKDNRSIEIHPYWYPPYPN